MHISSEPSHIRAIRIKNLLVVKTVFFKIHISTFYFIKDLKIQKISIIKKRYNLEYYMYKNSTFFLIWY